MLCFDTSLMVAAYLTCTVKAHAPAFSILLANSTVSLSVSSSRILTLTGTDRFLLRVLDDGVHTTKRTTQHTQYHTTYQHALQRRAFDVLYTSGLNMREVFDLLMVLCQRRSSDPATYRHQGIITVLNFIRSKTQRANNETRSPWPFCSCASSRTTTTALHDTSSGPQNTTA